MRRLLLLCTGLSLACAGFPGMAPPADWTAYAACRDGAADCSLPDAPTTEIRMGMALGSPLVADAMRAESELADNTHIRLNQRMKDADAIGWALEPDSGPNRLRDALSGLDPVLADIVAFSAVRAAPIASGEWVRLVDSDGEDTCGRGPLKLTTRQALRLGLDTQPAALVRADTDEAAQREALVVAATLDGIAPTVDGALQVGPEVRAGKVCVFVEGPDQRTDIDALADALARAIGPDAPGLPDTSDMRAIPARLARLYATDFASGFDDLTFDKDQPVKTLLANQSVPTDRREFVETQMAHALGAAIAARCMSPTDGPMEEPLKTGCEDALSQ